MTMTINRIALRNLKKGNKKNAITINASGSVIAENSIVTALRIRFLLWLCEIDSTSPYFLIYFRLTILWTG